jgi:2-polyprenyl-3-methyl-5-hydroxy-6-metoxy-1,4-benzoquinol methylase
MAEGSIKLSEWLDGEMTDRLDAATQAMMQTNQANWDARTPVHVASQFYGLDGAKDPFYWFAEFEWEDLGELEGRDVLHLQCHLGTETIAFAHKGARTVGLDFSAEAVTQARQIAQQAGVEVEYVQSNVYDAVSALGGRRFDVVYTGKGSLAHLPDVHRWAAVAAKLLRPDGRLYVAEFHPLLGALDHTAQQGAGLDLVLDKDYLEGRGAQECEATYTYTDGPAVQGATVAYQWAHSIGEVVNALLGVGLRITRLRETTAVPWRQWEEMVPTDNGWWQFPDNAPRVPLLYALRASKEE